MKLGVLILGLTLSAPVMALSPQELLEQAAKTNPRFKEVGLQVRESEKSLESQESLRPWTLRADVGVSYDEQPSSGVIEDGTRKSTFGTAGVEVLKQFVIGTQLSVRLDWNRSRAEIPFTVPDFNISEVRIIGPNYGGNLSARITQPLLKNFGSEVNELPETAARLQLDVARLTQARAAQDLVVDVLNAYWTYSRATMEAEALRASLKRTKDFGELTLAQIEAGQLAELERDIVSQRVSQAEQALILAEAQVLDAWESLQVSMGKSPGAEPVAPEFGETPRDSFSVESVLERARQSNPELLLLSQELRSAELNLVRSENQTEPQLDAVASLTQRSLSEEVSPSFTQIATLDYTSLFLGLNFVIPLDNTLATAQLEADEIAVERARWRYTEAELQIERQVRQAIRLYETQKKRAELSVDEVRLARKNLEATNLKYAGGLASYLEVMELERTLQDAEIRAAQTELDVKLAHMGVLRLTGELLDQWNVEME